MNNLLPSGELLLQLSLIGAGSFSALLYFFKKPDKKHKKVNDFFRNSKLYINLGEDRKIYPKLINHQNYNNGDMFIYTIPNGMAISQFKDKKEALSHSLKGEVELWNQHNRLFIRSYTEEVKKLIECDTDFIINKLENIRLGLPVGYSHQGFIVHDLSGPGKHVLIGGTTNYGKSNLMHVFITSAMLAYTPKAVQFNLLDLKEGVEFKDYTDMPHMNNYAETIEETIMILEGLIKEHKYRMKLVKKAGERNINKLNMPRIITVIDEFAVLSNDNRIIDMITYLLQQGRAAGLHFILATQQPKAKFVPTEIKINCDVRIALRMKSSTDSMVILDNPLASNLPPIQGRAIYQFGDDIELQIPLLKDDIMRKLLKDRKEELINLEEENNILEFGGEII